MLPLQVWLPTFDSGAALDSTKRAIERARRVWQGESCVWLAPTYKKPLAWTISAEGHTLRELAIPGECHERIDVFHVGKNGYLQGAWPRRFHEFTIDDGLLSSWLNLFLGKRRPQIHPVRAYQTRVFPIIRNGNIEYVHKPFYPSSRGGTFSFSFEETEAETGVDDSTKEKGLIRARWPPEHATWPTVRPAEESRELYGELDLLAGPDPDTGVPIAYHQNRREPELKSLGIHYSFPPPLDLLFIASAAQDVLLAQTQMCDLVKQQAENLPAALHKAEELASPYVVPGSAPRQFAWLEPTIGQVGIDGLPMEIEGHLGMSFADLDEALASDDFQKKAKEPMPISCCFGVTGLLWALFLERLRAGPTIKACGRCGRVFEGYRHKKFCGPRDDKQCYRERRREDKRRERGKPRR